MHKNCSGKGLYIATLANIVYFQVIASYGYSYRHKIINCIYMPYIVTLSFSGYLHKLEKLKN